MMLIRTFVICSCLLLCGCAQITSTSGVSKTRRAHLLQDMQVWTAEGRIAISDAKQSMNASFTWEQNASRYRIQFYSPYTTETVTVTGMGSDFQAVVNNGETGEAVQLEEHLPFVQLSSWLKGLPADTSTPTLAQYDAQNQLQRMQQDGWLIEYQNFQPGIPCTLPDKLTISNKVLKVKLVIKNWQN